MVNVNSVGIFLSASINRDAFASNFYSAYLIQESLSTAETFKEKIQMERCEFNCDYDNSIFDIKTKESALNKGFFVDKKTCIFKRPVYDEGEWVNQYNVSDIYTHGIQSGMLFNHQSKAKTNSNSNKSIIDLSNCDSSLLGACDKGPFSTYAQTFTNSYDNCV